MAPHQALEVLERDLGLTWRDIAGALDVDRRTLDRWASGESWPRRQARGKLAQLLALRDHLHDTFSDSDAISRWLRAPSTYLGGMEPVDAIRASRCDRVEAALEALDSGVFV